jgi:hypothetical protein
MVRTSAMLRRLHLVILLLLLGIFRDAQAAPILTTRPPTPFAQRIGNACQTLTLCAAIERLGLYANLQLSTALTPSETGSETALGGSLGIGLDLIRHVALEVSIPATVVYQGTAPTLLSGGPLVLGTRLVFGSSSPTLFSERAAPRWALILASYAQLRLPYLQGDERAESVPQTGWLQPSAHAAVELNWGPAQFTPELTALFTKHEVDLRLGGRLSLQLSNSVVVDFEAQSRIPLYVSDSQTTCDSSARAGIGIRAVLGTGILGSASYSGGSGTCPTGHQLSLGITFAFGEGSLRRLPTGESLGIERFWLGMVDPVLDCNGWMLADDTLLPLFQFGEPDSVDPTIIRRGNETFQVGDHFDIDRYGRLYRPHQLVALASEHEFKEASGREKSRLTACTFGPRHRYQEQCALRQRVIDDLERQALCEGGAGLTASTVMRLQLDRDCFSKGDIDDPRQLATDIAGILGSMKGVLPARREVAEHTTPPKEYRSTFLRENEARGGHVLEKHVGKTDQELIARLKAEPHLRKVSTFTDEATAERVIKAAIAENQEMVHKWLNVGKNTDLDLVVDAPEAIGRLVSRGTSSSVDGKSAVVVLRRAANGYYVITAYVR